MLRLSLIPEDRRFYDFIEKAGANMAETARALDDVLSGRLGIPEGLQRIRDLEHAGDEITHDVMNALNQTFITPLDREDIAFLIRKLDDLVDKMWAASLRLQIYEITEMTPIAGRFGQLILRQAEMVAEALPKLRRKREMTSLLAVGVEINRIENEGDELLHEGLASALARPANLDDLILGLKWKEIYDYLEQATDVAEDVADALESIVLKYA